MVLFVIQEKCPEKSGIKEIAIEDITKAKEILGWEPKVDRAEGLKKTYEYFKSLPKEELYKLPKEFTSNK